MAPDLAKTWGWRVGAFVWGVAEGTLFFIVPDVLLSFMGLKRGARAAGFVSLIAAVGAACGGVIMYLWSASDPAGAHAAVLAVPAISTRMADAAQAAMRENWFLATLEGPLSRTPYKVYAILAPQIGAPLPLFALASIAARLPRFLLSGLFAALARRWLGRWFSETQLTWALAAFWLVFYALFFTLTPG